MSTVASTSEIVPSRRERTLETSHVPPVRVPLDRLVRLTDDWTTNSELASTVPWLVKLAVSMVRLPGLTASSNPSLMRAKSPVIAPRCCQVIRRGGDRAVRGQNETARQDHKG